MPPGRIRRRFCFALAAGLPACTSFHADLSGTAAGPVETCDPTANFGSPKPVEGLNSNALQDVGGLRLSPNSLIAYFHATDDTGEHLYVATRREPALPFNYVGPIVGSGITTGYYDSDPTVSADGRILLFARGQAMDVKAHIYWATRARTSDPFADVSPASGLNSYGLFDAYPFLVQSLPADGQADNGPVVYFDSSRMPQNSADIYRATWTSSPDDMTIDAIGVDAVNTPASEIAPVVTPDETTMFFASDRTDDTLGQFDIWESRQTVPGYWDVPHNVTELNSVGYDEPTFVTSSGCTLYFSSNRSGTLEMYVATRLVRDGGG